MAALENLHLGRNLAVVCLQDKQAHSRCRSGRHRWLHGCGNAPVAQDIGMAGDGAQFQIVVPSTHALTLQGSALAGGGRDEVYRGELLTCLLVIKPDPAMPASALSSFTAQ